MLKFLFNKPDNMCEENNEISYEKWIIIAAFKWLVSRRFEIKKNIVENLIREIKKNMKDDNNIDINIDKVEIVDEDKIKEIDKNEDNLYISIPVEGSRYEDIDFLLVCSFRLWKGLYWYTNIYYLVDNDKYYYITEVGVEFE